MRPNSLFQTVRLVSSRRAASAAALFLAVITLFAATPALAQVPTGYYDSAEGLSGTSLRNALHNIIDGHDALSYNGAKDELWEFVEIRNEGSGNFIECIYTGRRTTSFTRDSDGMNAEHTWPQSRGAGSTPPRSDMHHLFVVDSGWNSRRGSLVFNDVPDGSTSATSPIGAKYNGSIGFEPPDEYKGQVARAILYFAVRYELPVNDTGPLQGSNSSTADDNMGRLTKLLEWHAQYPPSTHEQNRNNRIYSIQENRNPFIDRPEFACLIWGSEGCGEPDSDPPAAPTGLGATGAPLRIELDWNNNTEPDLRGYNVYRATATGGPYSKITSEPVSTSDYTDSPLTAGETFFYRVRAVDFSGNESPDSNTADATAQEGGGTIDGDAWINEIHYDNLNVDTGEFVELAGPAGMSLDGYLLELYNGSNDSTYDSVDLSGMSLNSAGDCVGFIVIDFPENGIQNGAPDGMALSKNGTLIQFLSYEGTITASNGVAAGQTSTDIGVEETNSTPVGQSLQLGGTGSAYSDFSWQEAASSTRATTNLNQIFTCGSSDTEPPLPPTGLAITPGNGQAFLTWNANSEEDLAGYNVYRSLEEGVLGTKRNGSPVVGTARTESGLTNGVTYWYTITAEDTSGNESFHTQEVVVRPFEPIPHGMMVQ